MSPALRFEIVHEPGIGWYVYRFENDVCTHDFLQDTRKMAETFSHTQWAIPPLAWVEQTTT